MNEKIAKELGAHMWSLEELAASRIELINKVAALESLLEKCEGALGSVDKYFKALAKSWAKNKGRVVSASGFVLQGSEQIESICNRAGNEVPEALAAIRAYREGKG